MRQVIERHRLQSERIDGLEGAPSVELQLESATHSVLSKEIAEKTQELRQLRGEDLHGLNLDQLKQLEKLVQGGLSQITETKDERFLKEISTLEKKGAELKEENLILKQQANHQSHFPIFTNLETPLPLLKGITPLIFHSPWGYLSLADRKGCCEEMLLIFA
ncbi:hypothetical protein ES319_D12G018100v1 [Gossypium barbadense]|uniref:K-box domain-containing protein n=1 Tax=Gossypium barbadense TaxID=3634 RepID=A0A5J5NVL4_GOSBA|nr:hypothetical protein ES319_D12G018100v1 [Gossypium barbadense]